LLNAQAMTKEGTTMARGLIENTLKLAFKTYLRANARVLAARSALAGDWQDLPTDRRCEGSVEQANEPAVILEAAKEDSQQQVRTQAPPAPSPTGSAAAPAKVAARRRRAPAAPERPMRDSAPVEMLKADHRRVEQLFSQYRQAIDPALKKAIAEQVLHALEAHGELEEILYAATGASGEGQRSGRFEKRYREHDAIEGALEELKAMGSIDPEFETMFQELRQRVEQHIQEEETELLPEAQARLGSRSEELGREMAARRAQPSAAAH
jgi:hypothetical protein